MASEYRRISQADSQSEASASEDIDSNEKLLGDGNVSDRRRPYYSWRQTTHWALHIGSFGLLLLLLVTLTVREGSQPRIVDQIHAYSPARTVLGDAFSPVRFNGTIRGSSPFKGPPSPSVEAAWNKIIRVGHIRVSRDEMIGMGKTLDSVQIPAELGGGYLALPESIHYLHCLHSVWQDHYLAENPDYFPEEVQKAHFSLDAEKRGLHFEHCIDMIRQKLMCDTDPGLITFRWVKGKPDPRPDFNLLHTCQSADATATKALVVDKDWEDSGSPFSGYEALARWNDGRIVRNHGKPMEDYPWVIPDDAVILPTPP